MRLAITCFAQNLAFTLSVELLIDPALNPEEREI